MKRQRIPNFVWNLSVNDVIKLVDPYFMAIEHNFQAKELSYWPQPNSYSENLILDFENSISSFIESLNLKQSKVNEIIYFAISAICALEIEISTKGRYIVRRFHADWFDSDIYLKRYPDVSVSGIEPLYHFLTHGYLEGRYSTCMLHPKILGLESMRAVYELASESETHEVSSFFSTHHHSDFALTADLIMGSLNNARPKSNEVNTQIIKSTNDGLPIISFIIPCFNQADYLRELLLSIGDSTVQPHECLIINDGNSRESEVRKIYDVSTEHSHQAIKILSTENRGLSGARNVGIQFASGDYVKFIDADDLLIFGSVDRQIEIIESTKSDACVGGYLYFGHGNGYAIEVSDPFQNFRMNTCSEKDLWRIDFFLENWEQGLGIPIHSLLIKREFVVNFDETLKSKEDLDYWLRLIASGISFETYSDFVAIYRIHASQMTKGKILLQGYYFLQILANVHSYTGSDGKDMFEVTKRKMKFIDQIYGESARQLFKLLNDPKVSKGQAIGIGL